MGSSKDLGTKNKTPRDKTLRITMMYRFRGRYISRADRVESYSYAHIYRRATRLATATLRLMAEFNFEILRDFMMSETGRPRAVGFCLMRRRDDR